MKDLKQIKPGSIIHSEKPFVYCLSSKVRTQNCDNCFKKGDLLKCTACKYVSYCDKVCQKESWSLHKWECKYLSHIAPRILPDAARLLSRLIIKLKKGGAQIKSYYTSLNFRMFKDLMSHYPDIKKDKTRLEHFSSLYSVLAQFFKNDILPNSAELMGIYGRMCVNSFSICNDEQQSLGTGVYLGASVVDHSCEPNAVAIFDGITLHIRALKSMQYLDWSQIFISYIDTMNTTQKRQEELQRTYYFLCECPKCLRPDPVEVNAAACPNKLCSNSITNIESAKNCNACGEIITADFIKQFQEITDFTQLHLQNMKDIAYIDTCLICLEKQKGFLHELNMDHVKTLDLAFESSINLGKFDLAEELGNQLVKPFHKYYGKLDPLTGLLHLKLGKIQLLHDKQDLGLKNVKEAYQIGRAHV